MQNTRVVTKEVAKQIEKASEGKIKFNFGEGKCLDVTVVVNDEFSFSMSYRDYQVEVRQILPEVEYLVSYMAETIDGDRIPVTKSFETDEDRNDFTAKLETDYTLAIKKV